MSFFKKALASVGIGGLKIDSVFDLPQVNAGDTVSGKVVVKGGKIDQEVHKIEMHLVATMNVEDGTRVIEHENGAETKVHENHTVILSKYRISEAFSVEKGSLREIPFTITLPVDVPVSFGDSRVVMLTEADVPNAIDPSDRDSLIIKPHPLQQLAMKCFANLGLHLVDSEFEKKKKGMPTRLPVVQELEFKPKGGPFSGRLDELEVLFIASKTKLHVVMEIDKKGNWLEESWGLDEAKMKFDMDWEFDYCEEDLTQDFARLINHFC